MWQTWVTWKVEQKSKGSIQKQFKAFGEASENLSRVTKILFLKEKLVIISLETCRWALCSSSWRCRHANGCCVVFCVHFLFSSQQSLYDHRPFPFHSPPFIAKKKLGNLWAPGKTFSLIPQPPFQTCLSFKQAKWKKLSIFWDTNNVINTVLCNRLFLL